MVFYDQCKGSLQTKTRGAKNSLSDEFLTSTLRIRAEVSSGTSTTSFPSLVLRHYRNGDARLTNPGHYRTVEDRTKTEDEIKKAEQHEVLKQMLLRLLDDPQVQRKIVIFLSRRLGQIRGE